MYQTSSQLDESKLRQQVLSQFQCPLATSLLNNLNIQPQKEDESFIGNNNNNTCMLDKTIGCPFGHDDNEKGDLSTTTSLLVPLPPYICVDHLLGRCNASVNSEADSKGNNALTLTIGYNNISLTFLFTFFRWNYFQ